jgi:hypothetical protein
VKEDDVMVATVDDRLETRIESHGRRANWRRRRHDLKFV